MANIPKKLKVDYTPFLKWNDKRRSNIVLAEHARRMGVTVSNALIGRYIKRGQPFPGEVILAWKNIYQWSDAETMLYMLNGKPIEEPVNTYEKMKTSDLYIALSEINQELARRADE